MNKTAEICRISANFRRFFVFKADIINKDIHIAKYRGILRTEARLP